MEAKYSKHGVVEVSTSFLEGNHHFFHRSRKIFTLNENSDLLEKCV